MRGMSRSRSLHAALAVWLLVFLAPATAQQRLPAPRTDWGQWERLVPHARATPTGPLSPDGRWLVYGITRTNGKNELRIVNVADGTTKTAAFGEQPAFSADSKWIAYAIGYSEAEQEKLRKQKKPIQRKLGVMTLASGETQTFDAVESFAFDESGTRLALRHYPPEPEKKDEPAVSSAAGADEDEPRGATLLVLDLASGGTMTFGNVSEYAWQPKGPSTALGAGRLLAMTVRPPQGAGHGVHVFDPSSGAVRVLDSGEAPYTGLSWRKDADDLTVLRAKTDARRDGPAQVLLAWTGSSAGGRAHTLDPTLPSGRRTVDWTKPVWSHDRGVVFVGVADWDEKPPEPPKPAPGDAEEEDEPAAVDVWHSRDVDVMPKQKINARRDRRRTLLHAWHVDSGRLVPLARTFSEDVQPLKGQNAALLVDRTPYQMPRSFGRIGADLHIVDVRTGERRKVRERVNERYVQPSGNGRYLLFFDADHYWTYDVANGTTTNITKAIATSFTNRESDATTPQKPPYGAAGWTLDETAVLLYDKFDIWEVKADGSRAARLTDGATDQMDHRYVRFDRDEDGIDRTKPIYFRVHGLWAKRSGYAVLRPGATVAERLLWQDKAIDSLARATNADVHAYIVQGFDDSPDYFVAGSSLSSARVVTETNAFHSRYAWGRSELVEYKSDRGERLQGALLYPANYERGKAYPMIVYMYEKLSDDLHLYTPLSDRQYYNVSVFTSLGYFVLKPDIVFRPRDPGISVVECVVPAVKRVVQMGLVDPQRIGILGHSWGGFDTTFLATHTDTFAAAVAGAPITDLISNYGNHHWSQGIAETDHIETGQQRMQVPLWEDLPAYIRNSAVFGVATMKTPLLLEAGDNDGTVHWHQSVELYNVARRAGKQVAMVVYAGEDHGLRKKANQQDYQQRIIDWFGHYLQGQPAAAWIEKGVTFLQSERDRKMRRPAVPKTTTNHESQITNRK
jgi:dipeptidyl aminopeptidase/acylaminoacyl peptidase